MSEMPGKIWVGNKKAGKDLFGASSIQCKGTKYIREDIHQAALQSANEVIDRCAHELEVIRAGNNILPTYEMASIILDIIAAYKAGGGGFEE